ncbi:MAG TPA: cytochrome c [Cytophagaceae bacterium]
MSYLLFASVVALTSCNHNFDHIGVHTTPRWEFAPNMYHSEAYEPLSQVTDSISNPEAYNSNPYNPHGMNMRVPPAGTIKRESMLPYAFPKDCLDYVAANVKSPIQVTEKVLAEGEVLYTKFCAHCHGDAGKGDGAVSKSFKGIADLTNQRLKGVSEAYIFHVITHGQGRMWSHASQIDQEERWKIAAYVKEVLQKTE